MSGTLETLGFYFAWDKDGRYPIDASQPILLDENRKATVYLTHRPIQEEDGHWYWWEIYPFERKTISDIRIGGGDYYFLYTGVKESRNGVIIRAGAKRESVLRGTIRECLVRSIRFVKPECSGLTEVSFGDFAYLANRVDDVSILQESIPQTRQIGSDTFADIEEASISFPTGYCGGVEIDWIVKKGSVFACELFDIAYNDATGKIDVSVSPLVGKRVEFSTTAYIAPGDRVRCSIHWENGEVRIFVGGEEHVERGDFSFPPRYHVEQDDAINVSLSGLFYHMYFVIYPRNIRSVRKPHVHIYSSYLWQHGRDFYRQYNESIASHYGFTRPVFDNSYSGYTHVGGAWQTSPVDAKRLFFGSPWAAKNYIEQGIKIDIDASGSYREEVYLWATLNGALMHFAHKMRLTPKVDGDIEVELVDTRVI